MIATLDEEHVRVWQKDDADGGRQTHVQQPTFCSDALPLFQAKYVEDDGGSNDLSVVTKHVFP